MAKSQPVSVAGSPCGRPRGNAYALYLSQFVALREARHLGLPEVRR